MTTINDSVDIIYDIRSIGNSSFGSRGAATALRIYTQAESPNP